MVVTLVVYVGVEYDYWKSVLLKRRVFVDLTERQRGHTAIALVAIHCRYIDYVLEVIVDGRLGDYLDVCLSARLFRQRVRLYITELAYLYLLLVPKTDTPPKV